MKIKKNLINNNFFKSIFKEIHLLIIILLVAFSLAFYMSKKQTPMIKETYSKATISLPQIEMFSINHISHNIFFNKIMVSHEVLDAELLRQRFNINLTSNLISSKNLEKFLDLETSSNYTQFFEQKGMYIKNYFIHDNFEIISSPIDKERQFIFILSMKHPLGLNEFGFLRNYIEFTKNNLLDEYIKKSNDQINRLILLLQNNLYMNKNSNIINENGEVNRVELLKLLIDEFLDDLSNNKSILEYFKGLKDTSIIRKIDFLNSLKNDIRKMSYDPILEIRTLEYYEKNLIYRYTVLSILISFVVFFSIIIFKQVYIDFLKKK